MTQNLILYTLGSDALLRQLRRKVKAVLSAHAQSTISGDLARLLQRPGYALDPDGPCRAGLLSLEVYGALREEPLPDHAFLAAAAVEVQMEAAYIFDEVADSDPYPERSEHLALAIALLTAGSSAAYEAASFSLDALVTMRHFCGAYGEACAGQFLDALYQRQGMPTLEDALQTTYLKAGALGKFAAGFAARVAGGKKEHVPLFEQFGSDTFTLGQLLDDLRDASALGHDSDLFRGKPTLPVVFHTQRVSSLVASGGMLRGDKSQAYGSSGAPLYGAILAQAYLGRAQDDLLVLAQYGYAIAGLAGFLEKVDLGAARTFSASVEGLVP